MPVDGISFTTCGDLVPSGHIGFVTIALVALLRELPRRFLYCSVFFRNLNADRKNFVLGCFIYELITGYFIIATRKHYTVDVVVGFFLSFFMSIFRVWFSVERSSSRMGGSPPCSEMKLPILLYLLIVRFDLFGCVCWKRREMLESQRMNENEIQVAFSPLKEDSPAPKKYSLFFNFKRRKIVPLSDTQLLSPPKVFPFKFIVIRKDSMKRRHESVESEEAAFIPKKIDIEKEIQSFITTPLLEISSDGGAHVLCWLILESR